MGTVPLGLRALAWRAGPKSMGKRWVASVFGARFIPGNALRCPAKPGTGRHPGPGHVAMLPRQGPATDSSDLAN
jgi:hypothetical protein